MRLSRVGKAMVAASAGQADSPRIVMSSERVLGLAQSGLGRPRAGGLTGFAGRLGASFGTRYTAG
jgi:hypothetical protein